MAGIFNWRTVCGCALAFAGSLASAAAVPQALPHPPPAFKGHVDPSRDHSVPDWPAPVQAPKGAPNIVVILLDDVGYGAGSLFGGPVPMPALEKLAARGLRYNSFHVNALCSPTRAALLSGRNDHQLGYGVVTGASSGFPGYNATWGPEYASVAEILRQNGYSTALFGKWHQTPIWETTPAGPFDRWPTGKGFEYFYGHLASAESQWETRLYRNTTPVEPGDTPENGYHLTTDVANEAIRWLHQHDAVAPDKPFFIHYATSGTHAPHHAPKAWIDKFKGQFDLGWDRLREQTFARQKALGVIPADAELTPRPKELPAWDSLSADEKKLLARQEEVYAGYLAQTDYEVGRVLDAIREEGKSDNTLVFYIAGDNGAEAAGGLTGQDMRAADGSKEKDLSKRLARADELGSVSFYNLYASAWAWAMDTPFQWSKQVASHLGGVTDPLIVSWPARIKNAGGLRTQFHHVTDIAPTIYEVTGIPFPQVVNGVKQVPLEGKSLAYSFDAPAAPSNHHVQYFEMMGNRGIYKDGWWAGARFLLPWDRDAWDTAAIDQHPWELYDLNKDFSQAHDLAQQNPAKLKELEALFDSEAERNQVYPLAPYRAPFPTPADGKTSFTYREGVERIPLLTAPKLTVHHHVITADIDVPARGAQGVLMAYGGRYGGFVLYVKDGHVIYENNASGAARDRIVSSQTLSSGKARIVFEYDPQSVAAPDPQEGRDVTAGKATLSINGKTAGTASFAAFGGYTFDTLDIGKDLGEPVSDDYAVPFPYTGHIEKIQIDLKS